MKIVITHKEKQKKYAGFEDTKILFGFEELQHEQNIDWILIDWDIVADIEDFIVFFRTSSTIHYKPLFLTSSIISQNIQLLVDDTIFTEDEMNKSAELINQKIMNLNDNIDLKDPEAILLIYLLTRQNKCLEFTIAPELAQKVRYPLMEFYITDPLMAKKRVDALADEQILVPHKVLDEIQLCPFCHNGWLSFKNFCPICESIDIEKVQFIQCFACGNTEPEENFLTNDALVCVNCQTRLKHIGIDYDKPLKEFICKDNNHRFMDTAIESQCHSCHETFPPERVVSKKLASYKVSNKGISYLLNGKGLAYNPLKDKHNFLNHSAFTLFLNWYIQSSLRYPELSFSVCNIYVTNHQQLLEDYGLIGTKQLLHEFFKSLRQCFRETDLITKLDDEVATIIFSQSNASSMRAIEKNIKLIQDNTKNYAAITIQINSISSDMINLAEMNATNILTEIKI